MSTLTATFGARLGGALDDAEAVVACRLEGPSAQSTDVTRASGGGASASSRQSSASSDLCAFDLDEHAGGVVLHETDEPECTASRKTKGRKPTPCTVPVTLTRRRSVS